MSSSVDKDDESDVLF